MKNLSRHSASRRKQYPLSAVETEITFNPSQHKLPRHISTLETKSHRGVGSSPINYAPKLCRVPSDREQEVNLALDILKYQLSDRITQEKHLANVRCNLQRRLQKAKNQGNTELIGILQAEYQQLVITDYSNTGVSETG